MINSVNNINLNVPNKLNDNKEVVNNLNVNGNNSPTEIVDKTNSNKISDKSELNNLKESNIDPVSSNLSFNKLSSSSETPQQLKKDTNVLFQTMYNKDPENFKKILSTVYNQKDPAKINELVEQIKSGTLPLPDIKFVSSETLNGSNGAYSNENGGTIYLNESLKGNKSALLSVLIEETGHHFDNLLGGADTQGDEGQMLLASINKGEPLNEEEMSLLKQESDKGKIIVDGKEVEVEFALPLVAVWLGKAAIATTVDAFLEIAIGAITGTPPGLSTHVVNAMMNLIPGLGEGNKVENIAKLTKAIDKVLDVVKTFEKLNVPGSQKLLGNMTKYKDEMFKALESGDLSKAKNMFKSLIGSLREGQVASALEKNGAKVLQLGRDIKDPVTKKLLTDIDVISEEAGKKVFNQVKSGGAANVSRGSNSWDKFIQQIDRTVDVAKAEGASVKYYVDDISEDALAYLKSKGIQVIRNADFLD